MNTLFQIEICIDDLSQPNYTENITEAICFLTGFEPMELDFLGGIRNDCWVLDFTPNGLFLRYAPINTNGECETIEANYPFCGNEHTITIQINIISCQNVGTVENRRWYGSFYIGDLEIPSNFTGFIKNVTREVLSDHPNPQIIKYGITFNEPYETDEYSPIVNFGSVSYDPANFTMRHIVDNKTINGFDLIIRELVIGFQDLSITVQLI